MIWFSHMLSTPSDLEEFKWQRLRSNTSLIITQLERGVGVVDYDDYSKVL